MAALNKLIAKIIPNKKQRIKKRYEEKIQRYNKTHLYVKELLKNQYEDTYFIISNNGLGDVYFTASLIKEFKAENDGKVVFLLAKESLIDFVKMFPAIDGIIYDRRFADFLFGNNEIQRKMSKTDVNILRYPYRGKRINIVFKDNYVNLLGIENHHGFETPVLKNINHENAQQEFERLNLNPQKTIIIIPEAVMFNYNIISVDFWKSLAYEFEEAGYDVVFNTLNNNFKGLKRTFLPIVDFLAFAQKVKHIISFRSGINDVLTGMNLINQTVIYPANFDVLWADKHMLDLNYHMLHKKLYDNEFDNLKQIYSLNTNFNRNDICEIFFDGNEDELRALLFQRIR